VWSEIGDNIALKIQELKKKGKIDDRQPLLRIDYRSEAARAPLIFDIAKGKLHRANCRAIPKDSKAALYGIWEFEDADIKLVCNKCKPDMEKRGRVDKDKFSDMMYGFLSILDQFGSVLNERGKEYRNSDRGKALEKAFETVTSSLDVKQKNALNTLSSVMGNLFEVVKGCNESLSQRGNGKSHNGYSKRRNGGAASNGGRPRNGSTGSRGRKKFDK
jgi:hypothetical protein